MTWALELTELGSHRAGIFVIDALEAAMDCRVVVAAAFEDKNFAIAANLPMNCAVQEGARVGQQELHRMTGLGFQR